MIHAHINIEIKGDYSWDWEEQEAQEEFISEIKFRATRCIENSDLPTRTIVYINIQYYPDKRKFAVISSSRFLDEIVQAVRVDKWLKSHFC
jgi:hypothetical protein